LIDVGQGDGIHIKTPDGKNILIDGGGSVMKERDVGKDILYPYFMKNGVSAIDLAIVTHLHEDHYEGLSSLSRLMPVKKAALYAGYREREKWIEKTLNIASDDIIYLKGGQTIRIGRDVSVRVLYPEWPKDGLSDDENENSLVLRVDYRGVSFLNTGDLLENGEMKLLERYGRQNHTKYVNKTIDDRNGQTDNRNGQTDDRNEQTDNRDGLMSDLLKAGHHGAKTSNSRAFLEAASPGAVVIQVGRRNSFGHPSPEVTQRFSLLNVPVYRNDEQGAVLIDIDKKIGKKRVRILEMKEQMWHNY
jgi:competence protein ComEC